MNARPWTMALLAVGLIGWAPPGTATGCDGTSPWDQADQCETVTSPGSVEVQGFAVSTVGIGFCHMETTDVPFFCEAREGSLGGSGFGAATFDSATDGTGWAAGNREVKITVKYTQWAPCLAATLVCGFNALICNDRDLDGSCTNVGNANDELVNAYSNEPATDVDCDDGKKDDEKDCGDNDGTALGKTVCFTPGLHSGAGTLAFPDDPGRWNNADQIIVFIGAWAGKVTDNPADANLGAGISAGTYEVGLKDNGPGCAAVEPTVDYPTGCLWEADALSTPGGLAGDASAAAGYLLQDPADVNGAVAALTSGPFTGSGRCGVDCTRIVRVTSDWPALLPSGTRPVAQQLLPDPPTRPHHCGGSGQLTCEGATVIVLFVVGVGSSTAGEQGGPDCIDGPGTSFSAASPTFPLNAAVSGGSGLYTCDYVWATIAAGGCLAF